MGGNAGPRSTFETTDFQPTLPHMQKRTLDGEPLAVPARGLEEVHGKRRTDAPALEPRQYLRVQKDAAAANLAIVHEAGQLVAKPSLEAARVRNVRDGRRGRFRHSSAATPAGRGLRRSARAMMTAVAMTAHRASQIAAAGLD